MASPRAPVVSCDPGAPATPSSDTDSYVSAPGAAALAAEPPQFAPAPDESPPHRMDLAGSSPEPAPGPPASPYIVLSSPSPARPLPGPAPHIPPMATPLCDARTLPDVDGPASLDCTPCKSPRSPLVLPPPSPAPTARPPTPPAFTPAPSGARVEPAVPAVVGGDATVAGCTFSAKPGTRDSTSSASAKKADAVVVASESEDLGHTQSAPLSMKPTDVTVLVARAMSHLPLQNVAVQVPDLEDAFAPTQNVKAIVQALEGLLKAEKSNRRNDPYAVLHPERSIVIITTSRTRGDGWTELLAKHSAMSVGRRFIDAGERNSQLGRKRDRDEEEDLESLFAFKDVLVTHAAAALEDADRYFAYLRRAFLLVFDVHCKANSYHKERYFSDKGHPCSVFMRDHYQALYPKHRPRVLTIMARSRSLHPLELCPIEHNAFCKFATETNDKAVWRSCHGNGSRPFEAGFLDVETISYSVASTLETNAISNPVDRWRAAAKPKRDRQAMSALEHLAEQVGPMGISLYQRRRRHRLTSRSCGLHRTDGELHNAFRYKAESILLGLSQKTCHLLNELQLAYAASTVDDRLVAIIHAGRPTVAAALGEVIGALPVFDGLEVRVVMGCADGNSFETYSQDDDGETAPWQGEETDEEAVDSFNAGEANILIVASPYCTRGKKSMPLPACPLIIRFDGSMPDPVQDGGGGRCRVITFREKDNNARKKTPRPAGVDSPQPVRDSDSRENPKDDKAKGVAKSDKGERPPIPSPGRQSPSGSESCGGNRWRRGAIGPSRSRKPEVRNSVLEQDEGLYFYSRPARALLGPDATNLRPCYLYQIVPSLTTNVPDGYCDIGVDDYAIVLSERPGDDDLLIPLSDPSPRIENKSGIAGYLKLNPLGTVSLTREQIDVARKYTAAVFSAASRHLEISRFAWEWESDKTVDDTKAPKEGRTAHLSFLRRYVVLPTLKDSHTIPASRTQAVRSTKEGEGRAAVFARSFQSANSNEGRSFRSVVGVDWEAVDRLLSVDEAGDSSERKHQDNGLQAEEFRGLEGKFVVSGFRNESVRLCGRLCYNISPLSMVTRSQNFPLTADGVLEPHVDLPNLVNIAMSKEAFAMLQLPERKDREQNSPQPAKSSSANQTKAKENSELADPRTIQKVAVRWCEKKRTFVADSRNKSSKKRKRGDWSGDESEQSLIRINAKGMNLYDPTRNVKKKRRKWVGTVRYSYETYYRKLNRTDIRILDQPMLLSGKPNCCSYEQLVSAIRGRSVPDVCNDVVASSIHDSDITREQDLGKGKNVEGSKEQSDQTQEREGRNLALSKAFKKHVRTESKGENYLLPERCNVYPMSPGIIFMPAVLQSMERHLRICQLRRLFDEPLDVDSNLNSLAEAITASHVNPNTNYERYELLGDAVLKLTCTVRLFTENPHHTEGQMHNSRAHAVSNARLHKCAYSKGLQHFIRFSSETVKDWMPPGTDVHGKGQHVTVKALADVAEALCGHYFLAGVDKVVSANLESASSTHQVREQGNAQSEGESASPSDSSVPKAGGQVTEANTLARTNGKKRLRKSPLSAAAVESGYIAARRFLEECKVFEGPEPERAEILRSAIHAMCPKGSPKPTEVSLKSFPLDRRWSNPDKPWEEEFGPLEDKIAYKFKRRPLLICALTHGSYAKKHIKSSSAVKRDVKNISAEQTFQRLEFLGDAVADFCVVRYLFQKYPGLGPGALTNLKSNVVSNEAFARTTVSMGLHKYLFHASEALNTEIESFIAAMSREDSGDGHRVLKESLGEIAAPKVLGDIFEAVVGAIFVDSGLREAWRVCMRLLAHSLRVNADANNVDIHPATELQELLTRKWKVTTTAPTYMIEPDPSGQRQKLATLYVDGQKIATARGSTDKRARMKAAQAALTLLKDQSEGSPGVKLLNELHERNVRRRVEAQRLLAM